MKSQEIRDSFLNFFVEKNHKIIPSSSLVPRGDPTLLLTTAGMVQVKPYFLGTARPPHPRLTSCQKCFRTTDVDAVGDNKHLTFFEMLGNFSVGDYFKKEAIEYAWEFVTERLRLPPERLWVTIFLNDDAAFDIWRSIDFPENKIVRLGEEDNFWGPAGDSGPCGPCSEIHYDYGENYGCGKPGCNPSCSCSRFSEIWNLVFMEFNQDRNGNRTRLPKPNIDTGMGLERIVAVCQGKSSIYDTDLFSPIIDKICKITVTGIGQDPKTDRSIKIIAEHSRGIAFLIADGVLPSNEGRGYVLRRILRRACFLGRQLGIERQFIAEIAEVVINNMGQIYPELEANTKLIFDIIKNEEMKFDDTLDAGINLCEKAIKEAKAEHKDYLPSEEVFKFWDTYGFPFELSAEIAREHGLSIDRDGFEAEMEKQRERARAKHKFSGQLSPDTGHNVNASNSAFKSTEFIGYEKVAARSKIIQIIDAGTAAPLDKAVKGQNISLVLDRTPFYGEMGGQVGDTGKITSTSTEVKIENAVSHGADNIVLTGQVVVGSISIGDEVNAEIDEERRMDIARNHTATHILQTALRKVLGSHVSQRGSLVAPDRLRFDFTHVANIGKNQLKEIQAEANSIIRKNLPIIIENCTYDEAISAGATAIFEEKYGDIVRVVKIGEPRVSAELCGGTHVRYTGDIGLFIIVNEASIGTGLRRIEAVTGRGAEAFISSRFGLLDEAAGELKAVPSEVPSRIKNLVENLNSANKNISALQKELSRYEIERIIEQGLTDINGIKTIYTRVAPASMAAIMQMGDMLRERLKSAVIVLATVYEDKPYFMVTITPDLVARGLHSGTLVKKVSAVAGGGGGGKAEMAQAGAKFKEKIDEALKSVPGFIQELIKAKNA